MRLIDANALKKVLDDSLKGTYTIKDSKTASVMAGTMIACGILIDEIPTVDAVEVAHGRWEDGVCTVCGFDIRDMIDGESEFRGWVWECIPYCPNCGAKMN